MPTEEYIDCELYLSNFDKALLRLGNSQYSGKPVLDENLQRRLLEASLDATQYGTILFGALFPPNDDLLAGYREGLAIARHSDKRLRFRLHIDPKGPPELHALSWEMLYDAQKKLAFSRSKDIAFSRYATLDRDPRPAVEANPKLLVVISNPTDIAEQGLADLERGKAVESIKEALSPLAGLMQYDILEQRATRGNIRQRLNSGGFHALHIQAHGVMAAGQARASIVLEKDGGESDFVDDQFFSEVFEGNQDLRLITLVTCYSGPQTRGDPFGGLGPTLVRQGLPAVIAMRQTISVDAATIFSKHFYLNLAQTGRVDVAANEARQQLYLAVNPPPRDWNRPSLFMRLKDGKLWNNVNRVYQSHVSQGGSTIDWEPLLIYMSRNSVIPIVGPGINRGLLLSNEETSERWARDYGYPEGDSTDLPRVSKYVETTQGMNLPRVKLLEDLKSDLLEREGVQQRKNLKNLTLSEVIEKMAQQHFDRDQDEPHRLLAELPIRTYITTNFDSLMSAALQWTKRPPQRKSCLWWSASDEGTHSVINSSYQTLKGTYESPLVFHLFGQGENPRSLVLTEDDYLEFLRLVSRDPWRIPNYLKATLTDAMLLFLGYNVRALDFRVLFKGLVDQLKEGTLARIAVLQINTDDSYRQKVEARKALENFIEKDCANLKIQVYWGNVRDFLKELRSRWEKANA